MECYQILCDCGQPLRGERQSRHQVISCPRCNCSLFILPNSPFESSQQEIRKSPRSWQQSWTMPLLAAGCCLLLLLGGFALMLPRLARQKTTLDETSLPKGDPQTILSDMERGQKALAAGKFHLACQILTKTMHRREQQPQLLSLAQHRELAQLYRQADLLACLCPRPLEEIVRHALLVRDPDEWAAQFADYRGRSVVLDDILRRDSQGHPILANHVVEVDEERIHLALEELALLRDLPLDDAPRVIFGAKLARCTREENARWVIRFEPDSGVLLTELAAAQACFPQGGDETLPSTLQRQSRWLERFASIANRHR